MKSVSPGKGNFLSTISESKAPLVPRSLNHGHWGEKCDFDILQYTCPTNMSSEQGSRRSFRETFLRSTYPPMTSQSTSTDWRNRINSHQRYQLGAKKKERAHNVHELSIEPGKKKITSCLEIDLSSTFWPKFVFRKPPTISSSDF